MQNFP